MPISPKCLKAVVIDDEIHARDTIKHLLKISTSDIAICAESDNVSDGIKVINEQNPDIVFLDVEIIGGTGFDILENLDNIDFITIFITAHNHYAIKAIKFAAFDYLLKPIDMQELKDTLARACETFKVNNGNDNRFPELKKNLLGKPDKIALPTENGFSFIKISDIQRCKAESNYTRFFLHNKTTLLTSHTLLEYEKMLKEYNFIRVHNSHLVNMNHVSGYIKGKGGFVVMSDGAEVEVSVRKKEQFMENFTKL